MNLSGPPNPVRRPEYPSQALNEAPAYMTVSPSSKSTLQASTPASLDISAMFAELQLISDDDPSVSADAQQRLKEFERVLALLPPKFSTTLLLHRLAGLSIEEIGRQLGVSRPTAKKYLARALAQCRDALEERECRDVP